MSKPKVLATICARGGSKGVVGKNIRKLFDKPLIQYTLECATKTKSIDEIIISTDSDEIINVVKELGYNVDYKRPEHLAHDTSAKIDAIKDAVKFVIKNRNFTPDIIVDLDIGVPMRTPEDIELSISKLANTPDMQTLVTVYPAERNPYFNMIEQKENGFYSLVKIPNPTVIRRQDAPKVYSITPAIFAWKIDSLHITHLYEGKWGIHELPIERSIDIDTEFELNLVEFLMLKNKH
jgi:CMP-N,N'-diacetyllegionaminic acid synthase